MSEALELLRSTLSASEAWLVGGGVRDRLLGRPTVDLDIVIDGDPQAAARALARAAGRGRAASFALSEGFGAWRVVARDGSWQVDIERMRGENLHEDLQLRDFTINAIAEPMAGGEPIDPFSGRHDLAERRLRMVSSQAFVDDPLRVLRLVRLAVELDLTTEARTLLAATEAAGRLRSVAGERVFMELRRIFEAPAAPWGLDLLGVVGAVAVVLPEIEALREVEQSKYHHRDVYGHTLEVLEQVIALQGDPAAVLGEEHGDAVAALLAEPLADGLTRGGALRWGALLAETGMRAEGECPPASVDAAKPATRAVVPFTGRVTFMGHDRLGAELARDVLGRLRTSERLRAHVAALVRHHLRLGFMVHEPQPLARESVFGYLRACEPVEVDVTLLSVADRLATRGRRAPEAIEAHMRLARAMLTDALHWRAQGGPPPPLWRGDQLARELGIPLGPQVGELLEELARAQYAGRLHTQAQALDFARAHLGNRMRS